MKGAAPAPAPAAELDHLRRSSRLDVDGPGWLGSGAGDRRRPEDLFPSRTRDGGGAPGRWQGPYFGAAVEVGADLLVWTLEGPAGYGVSPQSPHNERFSNRLSHGSRASVVIVPGYKPGNP